MILKSNGISGTFTIIAFSSMDPVMTNISLLYAGALFLSGLQCADGFGVPAGEKTQTDVKKIVVVSDDAYPPYIFQDEAGNIRGILPDQWALWEQKSGVEVELKAMDWADAINEMRQGRADVIDTVFKTEDRERFLDFTSPYAEIEVPIYTQKDLGGIVDVSSLKGFTIGVKAGDAVIEILKSKGITSLVEYSGYEDLILDAKKGNIKVFSVDKPPAVYFLSKHGISNEFRESFLLYAGHFHRAVQKGRGDILGLVENGFHKISGGEYRKIDKKWMGTPFLFREFLRQCRTGLLGLAAAILALLLGNVTLSRMVQAKTSELRKSEEELREQKELLELFMLHSPIYSFIKDVTPTESRVLIASENFIQMIGIPGSQMRGKTMGELFPPEFASKITDDDISVVSKGEVLNVNEELNGRHYTSIKFPIINGNKTLLAGYTIDITERIRAEAALVESEKKYRMLTETMKDVVWVIDVDSAKYLYISPSVTLLRGFSVSEVLSGPVADSLVPGQFEKLEKIVRTNIADFVAGKTTSDDFFSLELTQPCKDGSTIITEAVVRIWRNPQTGKLELHGSTRDITKRKRIEENLRESRRQHAAMLARLPGMAYRCGNDCGWTMSFVSSGCLELTGYAPDDLIGSKRIAYGDIIRPAYREPVWEEWQRALREHRRFEGEYEIATITGDIRWVWEKGEGVYDEKGNVIALEGFIMDITQRVIAEKEKSMLQAQLVQAQKLESVGCLAGGVAHDFNNMLQAIIGYAEMALAQVSPDQPLHSDLVEIKKTALRSTNLTRQLLTFARRQTAAPVEFDIKEAIDDMSNMLHRLVGENIHLELKAESGLGDVLLDRGQFEQVLFNLCINARDAIGKSGHITVEATPVVVTHGHAIRQQGLKSGSYVKLSVKDDGPGIPKEIHDRIFEPFFTTKPMSEGSGLGLSVVYGIVTQANGVIHLESELGKGTDFQIYLPQCAHKEKAPGVPSPVKPSAPAVHATILLVDDEILILRPTKQILESMGHKVIPANSPLEAILLLDNSKDEINLLVTDVTMPDMSGPEMLVEMIKRHPKLKYIFMSGHTADLIAKQGFNEDKMNFIEKPFTRAELSAKIQEVLAEK